MKQLLLLSFFVLYHLVSVAQDVVTTDTATTTVVQQTPNGMTAADSLKLAFANMKSAITDINAFFKRKSDTIQIVVQNVEFDNLSLSQLKEDLKKQKNVRSVTLHFSAGTATLRVACKGKPADVWEALPSPLRTAFKVSEFNDAAITVTAVQHAP